MTPAPSNLRRPAVVARDGRGVAYRFVVEPDRPLPERLDPGYDDPRPLDWRELLDPWLWIGAVFVVVALVALCGLFIAVVPA
jgi:hypothetical protein